MFDFMSVYESCLAFFLNFANSICILYFIYLNHINTHCVKPKTEKIKLSLNI
jgi:hypothetical protein